MESFKAANPNGKLEDFIRWYSPRDWIEDETNKTDGKSCTDAKHLREKKTTTKTHKQLNIVEFHTDSNSSEDTNQPRKGRLSSRMLIPGNTWQNVWNTAKPVPARRQVYFFFESLFGFADWK